MISFKYNTAPFVSPTVTPRVVEAVGVAVDANCVVFVANFILDDGDDIDTKADDDNTAAAKMTNSSTGRIIVYDVINTTKDRTVLR